MPGLAAVAEVPVASVPLAGGAGGGAVCATPGVAPRVTATAGVSCRVSATPGVAPRVTATAGVEAC